MRKCRMEKYQVLKDISFNDVWELEPGQFKDECIKQLINCGFIKEKKQRFYQVGQRFKHGGDLYILGRSGYNQVILINLDDGNAWSFRGGKVEDIEKITEEEFSKITGSTYKFELVEE